MLLSQNKGYLTFDDMLDAADNFSLSALELDKLSGVIHQLGIIVYEIEPTKTENKEDHSRVDYNAIFDEIVGLSENLEPLINAVKNGPTPKKGEIPILTKQVQDGNEYARDRMIVLHLRVALKLALTYSKRYELDIEESVSAAIIGLCNAVDFFNPNGKSAFHSYASMWIQQSIGRECAPIWAEYYYPVHVREKMLKLFLKCKDYIVEDTFFSISDSEIETIATEFDLSKDEVCKMITAIINQRMLKMSIEDYLEKDSEAADGLECERYFCDDYDYEANIIDMIFVEQIDKTLSTIPSREEMVVRMRYGLGDFEPMTLEEVGLEFNITRERVRQIEAKALRKLSHPSRTKYLVY